MQNKKAIRSRKSFHKREAGKYWFFNLCNRTAWVTQKRKEKSKSENE